MWGGRGILWGGGGFGIIGGMKKINMFLGGVIFAAAAVGETGGLAFDAGADFRMRQELMHNVPGLPGEPSAMMSVPYKSHANQIRYRTRPWARLDWEEFTLFGRLVNEVREYPSQHAVKKRNRNYNFPDEVLLDNLYLEGRGLFDGLLDFRAGRQDLYRNGGSAVGLDRLALDGTAYDGSRSCHIDMLHFTLHPVDGGKLDAFAMYANGRSRPTWGHPSAQPRPITAIHPADSPERDEWGGGVVWSHTAELPWGGMPLPYQAYAVHKHTEAYTQFTGRRMEDKQITTLGMRFEPDITENVTLELEGAKQAGQRSDNTQAGGWMGYAGVEAHKAKETAGEVRPFARASVYYLSGDKDGAGDGGWDPMWARCPMDSDMMQYGTLYGLGWWSNILYPRMTVGANFGKMHRLAAYTGPLYAAVRDGMGRSDGGGGLFRGVLSSVRYDFPLLTAPKGARGAERFEVFGHVMAELFNPGDYYETSRPAYFIRWEVNFRF